MAKGKNNTKVVNIDRNRAAAVRAMTTPQWVPMQPIEVSDVAAADGVIGVFVNDRYACYQKQTQSSGFLMQGPDEKAVPVPITHLIVVRRDARAADWNDLQRIKNELVGAESDAVELFPANSRLLNMPKGQTHLWCLPPGYRMPLGLFPAPPVLDAAENDDVIPGMIKRSDLQFYVVESLQPHGEPPIVEVFADEADAKACYESTGVSLPDGGRLAMLGQIPMEEEGAAWSSGAVARRDEIGRRIAQASANMADEQSLRERSLLPAGPIGVEDEMEADGALGNVVDGPMDVMEASRLEAAMRAGMEAKQVSRDEEITEEIRAAREAGEKQAEADLAAMRKQLVSSGSIKRKDSDGSPEDIN